MASCARCGGPFSVCDRTLYCRKCNQIAALKVLGDECPYCSVDFCYDTTGNLVPVHRSGCPTVEAFRRFADELDNPGNDAQPPRPGR
jgi:hypothetical protein